MSVLGESNILDLSFKAFSSQEDNSSKNFSYDDYENITNQFSSVLTQQVNYEPKTNSSSSNDYVYKDESFDGGNTKNDITEKSDELNTTKEKDRSKFTDRREIFSKEHHHDIRRQSSRDVVPPASEHINFRDRVEQLAYSSKDVVPPASEHINFRDRVKQLAYSSKDVVPPASEHINFRDRVEQLAYSSKDISQILGDKHLSHSDAVKQKSKLQKILEQADVQTDVSQKKVVDKSQLQTDLSNRLSELHGRTQKTDSVNSLKEKLENLVKSISDKNQKQPEIQNLSKQTKQEQQPDIQAAKESVLQKNELLKTPSDKLTESLVDLNVEDIKTSKQDTSKSLKGQLNELAARASIKEADTSNNGENSLMNQHQESHDGMNSALNSLNSLLSNNSSTSKADGVNNTEFNRLLSSMEQQHNADADVLNQVVNNMKHNMTSINGKNSISMILNPQSLGRLNIDLISHNGILSAEIRTDNDHTKELLSKNIESLKQSLQEQGVTVGNMIVKTQESSLSNNNFTKDFSQDNMKGFDFGNNNKTGAQGQNLNQGERHSDYKQDLLNEEHNNMTLTENVHNGLVDYTI